MKFLKISIFFVFFVITNISAQDIKIIELHPYENNEEDLKYEILNQGEEILNDGLFNEKNEENNNLQIQDAINEEVSNQENLIEVNEEVSNQENLIEVNEEVQDIENNSEIFSVLGYWEHSNKDNLEYLFENLNNSNSKVINFYFIDSLTEFSKAPKLYTQAEFDYLRIKTLIKMGYKQDALRLLNDLSTYDSYKNFYDRIKLDSYLSTNKLSEACSFKDTLQEDDRDNNNTILKVSIFCSLLENKTEEADFLNSLLLDTQDKDEYFQKIYYNLKNDISDPIDITKGSFNKSSYALYSAMIRIGNLPFPEKFIEFDPANLSLSIILSSSTEISLRLKSAHVAYELGLFNAESLSALYQSVDFSTNELNNWQESLKKYLKEPEMGMALLFQNARIQLLPITRLESLKEFWNYAIDNSFEKLAYDVSKNLIESTEPSVELSEYSISIARAHIFNNNFQLAEKWISFFENYISEQDESDQKKLDTVKLLFNLQKSENKDIFIENLEKNLLEKIAEEETLDDYSETLKTIFSLILFENNLANKINYERKIIDERRMPSTYIMNTIIYSSENNNIGELILAILVSLDGRSWNDIHPEHLKILLESLKKAKLDNLFKYIIIEIFEESKII